MAENTWKAFSANVMRSLPAGSSFSDRNRALRAAGNLWRTRGPVASTSAKMRVRRNPMGYGNWREPRANPLLSQSNLLYAVGAVAVYWLVFRGTSHAWFAPETSGK